MIKRTLLNRSGIDKVVLSFEEAGWGSLKPVSGYPRVYTAKFLSRGHIRDSQAYKWENSAFLDYNALRQKLGVQHV